MRRTKIIGTIGPASDSPAVIRKLFDAGLNIARLNMSHGDHSKHYSRIKALRSVDPQCAILIDLQGPKIRTGKLKKGHVMLHAGNKFVVTTRKIEGDEHSVGTTYMGLTRDIKSGDRILIDDGLIELRATRVHGTDVECIVINGGVLKDFKGLNLPGVKVHAPALTPKDRQDLIFAIAHKVDYVALSFVRTPQDILKVKNIIKSEGSDIKVVAKIEKPEAVKNIDDIIKVSDAVMVARGDLGVELSPEKVPVVQKMIIGKCNVYGKPVIIATQMLESMVLNPRPSRAEASDVANAVFDEADVLMLSEEVAVGKHPVESVKEMAKIICEIENQMYSGYREISGILLQNSVASAVAHAASHTAQELKAKAMIAFTSSGSTALLVSKFKTEVPVFAVTTEPATFRRAKLYFGVTPVLSKSFKGTDEMIAKAESAMISNGYVKKGDLTVLVAGIPVGKSGTTNLIKVHRIGESLTISR
jgi:pyruvate kinase